MTPSLLPLPPESTYSVPLKVLMVLLRINVPEFAFPIELAIIPVPGFTLESGEVTVKVVPAATSKAPPLTSK